MKLSELYWHRITPLHILLWPLSVLYGFFLSLKKISYWFDILPSVRLPVPVIIVDSISIDDGGKTPFTVWLVDCLLAQGYSPGIITRGNTDNPGPPAAVTSNTNPDIVGGKTFLLAQRCAKKCPIWVGDNRIATAQALLNENPVCNVIICNDGLPDYRLERDLEIAVIDFNDHSFGNGLLIPAGPLRLNFKHLTKTDFIIINQKYKKPTAILEDRKTYNMRLVTETAYNVLNPEIRQPVAYFKDHRLLAVADEDNSRWFFDSIQKEGLNAQLHSFADNHRFVERDIHFPDGDAILMPEENALQCQSFAQLSLWALPKEVWIDSELQTVLFKKLENKISSLYQK